MNPCSYYPADSSLCRVNLTKTVDRFTDELADQRIAHALERRGHDRVHCRAGVGFAKDVFQPVRKIHLVVVSGSWVSVHFPTPDGHLDSLRPEL